jgi:hypothetical protein
MCFGPSSAEKKAAAEQRAETELAKQEQVKDRAESKREDITDALSARSERQGTRGGGSGRRSLYSGSTGAGFLSRFR